MPLLVTPSRHVSSTPALACTRKQTSCRQRSDLSALVIVILSTFATPASCGRGAPKEVGTPTLAQQQAPGCARSRRRRDVPRGTAPYAVPYVKGKRETPTTLDGTATASSRPTMVCWSGRRTSSFLGDGFGVRVDRRNRLPTGNARRCRCYSIAYRAAVARPNPGSVIRGEFRFFIRGIPLLIVLLARLLIRRPIRRRWRDVLVLALVTPRYHRIDVASPQLDPFPTVRVKWGATSCNR